MIYKATKLIKQEMDKQELNSSINEYEKSSNVQAGYNIQNGPYIQVDFISSDDDNDVAVRVFGFINHVAEDKEEKILKLYAFIAESPDGTFTAKQEKEVFKILKSFKVTQSIY